MAKEIMPMTFKTNAKKAVDALFAKFGQTAHFTFKDNSTGEGLVIHRFPDKVIDVMDTRVHTETDLFEIRALDIEVCKAIYQITIDGKTYTVQGEPMLDQHGIVLRMEAYAS
jgi:hypothetical protein